MIVNQVGHVVNFKQRNNQHGGWKKLSAQQNQQKCVFPFVFIACQCLTVHGCKKDGKNGADKGNLQAV